MKNLKQVLEIVGKLDNSNLEYIDENHNQVIYADWLGENQREPKGSYGSRQHKLGYFKALNLMDLVDLLDNENVEVVVDDRSLIFRVNKQ